MWLFRFLFAVDVLAALIVVYFFFVGLADGSVSSFNMGLWLAILAIVAAVLGAGWALNGQGHRAAANAVLAVLAAPALLYGAFVLLLVITQPNWN